MCGRGEKAGSCDAHTKKPGQAHLVGLGRLETVGDRGCALGGRFDA